ncbi:MAG: tetratricopeptide repeat protein, partial [Nitrososphaeraceae archaeon]|nr:tetratricopeptide repeat protein [Nitrososphaeraceae archaeon]
MTKFFCSQIQSLFTILILLVFSALLITIVHQTVSAQVNTIHVTSDEATKLIDKGNVLAKLGIYNEAIELYDKALAIDPNYVPVLILKGLALNYLGKYSEAVVISDKALAIDPNYINASINKGTVLNILGKYNEAIESFDEALAIDPNAGVLSNKGLA